MKPLRGTVTINALAPLPARNAATDLLWAKLLANTLKKKLNLATTRAHIHIVRIAVDEKVSQGTQISPDRPFMEFSSLGIDKEGATTQAFDMFNG
jgi:DNA-binding GntR family transcriptional regulator